MEEGVGDEQLVICTEAQEPEPVSFHLPSPVLANDFAPNFEVGADPGIEVAKERNLVCFRNSLDDGIKGGVEVMFALFGGIQRWSIGTDDGHTPVIGEWDFE